MKKKAFFPAFPGFCQVLVGLCKRARLAEKRRKGRTRLISRKGGQIPFKPRFVTPQFVATQISSLWSDCWPLSAPRSQRHNLRMRMRTLTRLENSRATFKHCESIPWQMRMVSRMQMRNFVLTAETPCK